MKRQTCDDCRATGPVDSSVGNDPGRPKTRLRCAVRAEKALRRAALSDPGICDDDSLSATSGFASTLSLGDWGLADVAETDLSPLEVALEALYEKVEAERTAKATRQTGEAAA